MTDLRIAVLGVGMMGADHVARLTERTKGATHLPLPWGKGFSDNDSLQDEK